MHSFQFLRLTDQENIYSPGMKNRKMLSKMLFFATSIAVDVFVEVSFATTIMIVVVKDTFTKGLPMFHCIDFVAYSYPGYELKYTDLIFMWQTRILAVMTP